MTKLETDIEIVLQQLQSKLASQTWESRRCYFKQILELAGMLNITEPCQTLFEAFVADDRGSEERRSLHIRCVKLLDEVAHTKAKDERGIFYNESPLPDETSVQEFFRQQKFPLFKNVDIAYLIVKAGIEMRHLSLSCSTIGQYRHAWVDIRRYCISHSITILQASMSAPIGSKLPQKRQLTLYPENPCFWRQKSCLGLKLLYTLI